MAEIKRVVLALYNTVTKRRFGSFGKSSRLIHPKQIRGKENIFIGDGVRILYDARIEAIRSYNGSPFRGKVVIESGVTIEQCCHIIAADELTIGRNSTVSAYCYIADCGHGFEDIETDVMLQELKVRQTSIGEGSFIGFGSCIMPGVTLGKHCVVGANSVVTRDVPDYTVVAGSPARELRHFDAEKRCWVKL